MPIQIEPTQEETVTLGLGARETAILDLMNVKLSTLDETAGEEELEETRRVWMRPLKDKIDGATGVGKLVLDNTDLRERNNPYEKEMFTKWKKLCTIWGYLPHHSYELITHCSGMTMFQSFTDPIMRILSRDDFHAFPSDTRSKANLSKTNEGTSFNYLNWARTKAHALWAVYFDQPEVLELITEICRHDIDESSSYAMATLVTFTRAWVSYCLEYEIDEFLDNVLTLGSAGAPAEEEGSSPGGGAAAAGASGMPAAAAGAAGEGLLEDPCDTDPKEVKECSPPRKKGRGANPGSKWVV